MTANHAAEFGSVIYARSCGPVQISSTNMTRNAAAGAGSIYSHTSVFQITESNFMENTAGSGSVVVIYSTTTAGQSTAKMSGCQFLSNRAAVQGGVAWVVHKNSTLQSHGDNYHDNSAGTNGGTFAIQEGNVQIEDSNITMSTAINNGGALFTQNANVTVVNTMVANCTAKIGGGP